MSTTILTSAWDAIILSFSPVFTQPTSQIFINLITGWILCTCRRTITGIMPFAEPKSKRPHDAYHRVFPKSRWQPSSLWKLLAQLLIGMFYPSGTVKHQRGPNRKKGRRLPTPTQIASRVKSWQRVKTCERGRTKYRLVYARVVIWYKVSHLPVLLVISRDPTGKEKDDFFFTTDLELTPAEVIGGFAGRWSIEDTFKNTKQSLGSEEPQTWEGQGPERAAVISLWLYSVVWAWYIRYGYRKSSIPIMPWYAAKTHPSFQDALATLRKVLWRKRIIVMFGNHTVPARIIEFFIKAVAAAA